MSVSRGLLGKETDHQFEPRRAERGKWTDRFEIAAQDARILSHTDTEQQGTNG